MPNDLLTIGSEFYQESKKLLTIEDSYESTTNNDYSSFAHSAQYGLRFSPTIYYFFNIFNITLPNIPLSSETKAFLDLSLGLVKIKASTFDNPLIPLQLFESGTYYATQKNMEIINSLPIDEKPEDLLSLIKICIPELANGIANGASTGNINYAIYGLISGAASCLSKHQLTTEETYTQANLRLTGDVLVGTLSCYLTPGGLFPKVITTMSNIVTTDIIAKALLSISNSELSGLDSITHHTIED